MNLSFLEPAQAEIEEAIDYYNERQASLGDELSARVDEAIGKILRNPSRAPRLSVNTRRFRIERFPYGILYQVRPGEILIVAFMHLRRDPEYWRSRVSPGSAGILPAK
jgi:plasmid stabilization system protein ParE